MPINQCRENNIIYYVESGQSKILKVLDNCWEI